MWDEMWEYRKLPREREYYRFEKQVECDRWTAKFRPFDPKAGRRRSRDFSGKKTLRIGMPDAGMTRTRGTTERTPMGNKFKGFGTMAAALAAAGLGMPAPAVAAAVVLAEGMFRFLLIEWEYSGERTWVKEIGGVYRSPDGDRKDIAGQKVLETVAAADFISLGCSKIVSYYHKPESGAGWLGPDASWWPNGFTGHGDMCYYVMGVTESYLEQNGWIHVDNSPSECEYQGRKRSYRIVGATSTDPRMPTAAQLKWLRERGHNVEAHGHGEKAKPVETITVGGVVLDKKAEEEAFERNMRAAGLTVEKKKSGLAAFR